MEEYGTLKFNNGAHPGKCEIDDRNNIIVTVYESDLNDGPDVILANFKHSCYEIYDNKLIDFEVGYYKFQASYLFNGGNFIKKIDRHIKKFEFTFSQLTQWLNLSIIKEFENGVKIEIPEDIILLDNEDIKVKIGFNKETDKNNSTKISIGVEAYIVVESKKAMSVDEIMKIIQIITRFFALIIGYTENVRNIITYESEPFEYKRFLIINTDFSNNVDAERSYNFYEFRTKWSDFKTSHFKNIFENWWNLNKNDNFSMVIQQFYSPYIGRCLEEEFLANVRVIEELYELKNEGNKKEIEENLRIDLGEFYQKHCDELKEIINNNTQLKSKHVRNYLNKAEQIHQDLINSVIGAYNMRKTLDVKLKEMDEYQELERILNNKDIINVDNKKCENMNVYNYIANTRNYYTHLSSNNSNIISDNVLSKYIRSLEKIIVHNLMKEIQLDENIISNLLQTDMYLNAWLLL